MPNLYIANATARNFHLHYRLPESERVYDYLIRQGSQYQIPDNHLQPEQRNAIVRQIEAYGAVDSNKIGGKGFSGIAFSERPVSFEALEQGISQTDQIAVERAIEAMKTNAIAADAKNAETAQEFGAQASALEMDVQEQPREGVARSELANTTVEVVREGAIKSQRGRRARS